MSSTSKNVLILAAHPDDEVLGCGGIIQKHVAEGCQVFVGVVTDGSSSQYPNDIQKHHTKIKECEEANKLLGVTEVVFLDFPDMKLDTVPHAELNNKINELVEKIRPNIIYTHSKFDLNLDHIAIARSTEVVSRPGKVYLEKVLAYEVLSSSEWSRMESFQPDVFVDVEQYLEKKVQALKLYKTECREYPHPRSSEGIQTLAQYRGLQSGFRRAEAFKLIVSYEK